MLREGIDREADLVVVGAADDADTAVAGATETGAAVILVSRRRLLKRAGAGALVLGAGSMLTASAAYGNQRLDICTQQAVDADVAACGQCASQTPCGAGCGCVPTTNGCCFCHQGVSCAGAIPCRYNQHCPAGWKCAATSCCGIAHCVPACGAVAAASGGALSTPG